MFFDMGYPLVMTNSSLLKKWPMAIIRQLIDLLFSDGGSFQFANS